MRFLSASSQNWLRTFLSDSSQKTKKTNETLTQNINLAIVQNSFVAIQLKADSQSGKVETIAGQVIQSNKLDSPTLIIRTTKSNQLRMIPRHTIRKIRVLSQKGLTDEKNKA